MQNPALVAIDLGAESCRVSLLRWIRGKPQVQVVHRFANGPIQRNGIRWNIGAMHRGLEKGLRLCAEAAGGMKIACIGVDGWAVDYVRLRDGRPIADPYCYRDERTVAAADRVHQIISPERLYRLTGIQYLRFNTVYQLYADGMEGIDQRTPWVNLPEYVTHLLGGDRVAEYTNATHTGLVEASSRDWYREIFETLGLELGAAPRLVQPGSLIGRVSGNLSKLPPFRETQLIAPACHDTASAIAGIPAEGNDWAFISSGTWSLVGTVLDKPCATEQARQKNFTNLGGAGGKICFLKNVNGMWILRQCLEEWQAQGHRWTIQELVEQSAEAGEPDHLIDVDDPELLLVGNMPARINAQRKKSGLPPLPSDSKGIVAMTNVVLRSLAARYAEILDDVSATTGKRLRRLYIVGGGSKNAVLNRWTAQSTGLEVRLGSPESTTVGNLAIQLASLEGEYSSATGVRHKTVAAWAATLQSDLSQFAVSKARRATASPGAHSGRRRGAVK